jgi:hypothetical protein
MSTRNSSEVGFLLIDGYSVLPSGPVTDIQDEINGMFVRSDGLGASWTAQSYINKRSAKFQQDGFFDDAANGVNVALRDSPGISRLLCFNVEGNVAGRGFTGFSGAMQVNYVRKASRDNLHLASANYDGNGQVDEGVIVHALAAEIATGNSQATPVDNTTLAQPAVAIVSSSVASPTVITTATPHGLTTGQVAFIANHAGSTPVINGAQTVTVLNLTQFTIAINVTVGGAGGTVIPASTVNGGFAYLQVPAVVLDGGTNMTIKLRHSVDNVTYVDLATFTNVAAAPAKERVAIVGTINRYVAWQVTFNGAGGANKSITFMAGLVRA